MTQLNTLEQLLRLPEVKAITGLNRNQIYSLEGFPRPVKISARSSAWVQSEVQQWIKGRIRLRGEAE